MARVQGGDNDAFAQLYDNLAGAVFGTVTAVVRDPAMSEEVTQEIFVELWRTAPRFDRTRAGVATWAITIARRRAVDRVRREQSQRNRVAELATRRDEDVSDPDELVVDTMEAEQVRAALGRLPDDQREIIELAFLHGQTHGEIAERLDLPLGTVKGRVRGGLRRLRRELGGSE